LEPALRCCRVEQIIAAHDLVDRLRSIIDDDRELIGEGAILASHDEIIDGAFDLSMCAVEEFNFGRVCAHSQRRLATTRAPPCQLGRAQLAADPGVARRCPVWRRGSLADLSASAPALVQQPVSTEPFERFAIERLAFALNDDRSIRLKSDRGEVAELLFGRAGASPSLV
jgi:hypothetical protein